MRGNWQDFNWHDASRGPSAIAELLVYGTRCIYNYKSQRQAGKRMRPSWCARTHTRTDNLKTQCLLAHLLDGRRHKTVGTSEIKCFAWTIWALDTCIGYKIKIQRAANICPQPVILQIAISWKLPIFDVNVHVWLTKYEYVVANFWFTELAVDHQLSAFHNILTWISFWNRAVWCAMWRWHSTQRRRRCQLRSCSEPRSPRRMFQRLEVALVEAGLQRPDRLQVRLRLGRRRRANSISRFPSAVLQATHDFTWLKSTLPATSCSALRYISCGVSRSRHSASSRWQLASAITTRWDEPSQTVRKYM